MAGEQVLREIEEQPAALARLLAAGRADAAALAQAARRHQLRLIVVVGRGSSGHATLLARYLWEYALALPVADAVPSLRSVYGRGARLGEDVLVVAFSQSGASPDVVAQVTAARADGALTCAITNDPASPLAQAAQHILALRAGPERSVPATKTYLCSLLAVYLVAEALAPGSLPAGALDRAPERVARLVAMSGEVAEVARAWQPVERALVVGRAFNLATAHEIALKLKETCYLSAEGFSTAELRHGPIALAEPRCPALVIAPPGPNYGESLQLLAELGERGVPRTAISAGEEALHLADHRLPIPFVEEEIVTPLTHVVPGQLLAVHLALARGLDPDRPRALGKVTRTR